MESKLSANEKMNMFENALKSFGPKNVVPEINNNDISDSKSAKFTSPDKSSTCVAINEMYQDRMPNNMKISSVDTSLAALVPKMENLELSEKTHSLKRLAGYIRAVVPPTGIVVVQLAPESRILDIGTVIFLQNHDSKTGDNCKKYEEIGFISDIFGSVLEPMYSLQLKQRVSDTSLRINAEVFYLHEHSSTRYISIRRDNENHFTLIYE